MKKTTLSVALLGSIFSASVLADGHGNNYSWGNWVQVASSVPTPEAIEANEAAEVPRASILTIPAGTANYAGSTVALVSDSSSGSAVLSTSTGAVNLAVTFNGTAATTETGTITGLTGTGGAKVGNLAFTGTGQNTNFSGTVTSATYPTVAATTTTAATGTGSIKGQLSNPVVITPAVAATATTAAVPAVSLAPLTANGSWNFIASSTLKVAGNFVGIKQ